MGIGNFSKPRLGRMHAVMANHVEQGLMPGIVSLISRRGEVYVDVTGRKELGGREPLQRDTIFRITSMTKPITAVATMILVEECKLRLDDPVDRWLPELADRRVLKRLDGPLNDTVAAHRPITVRDLLTFRLGFGMIMGPAEALPIQKAVAELKIACIGRPELIPHAPDEWIRRLGTLPLMCQPGERWLYNTGSYVLGVLIARVAGQPLEAFFRERIFEPLGMKDTSFSVPPGKLDRLATSYMANQQTGTLELIDKGDATSQWHRPPVFPDAGAGLVSTADDYLAFGQMLLGKGKLGAQRILSRASVEVMTTDQLTPAQKAVSAWFPGHWDNLGWGFGMSVVTGRDKLAASPGQFGWDGGYGTAWASDPKEDMVAVMLTQRAAFPLFNPVYQDFWTSVYQALDD